MMSKIMNNVRVVTNTVRASYVHVATPQSINGSDPKYSVSVIIDKDDKETIANINKAIDNAIEAGISKFGGKKPNKAALKLPLRDGDVERDDPAYENAFFVNCNNKTQPQVIDADHNVLDPAAIYSGCYVKVSIQFYAFNTNGNKGVAASLGNIQFIRDGESLGGGHITADDDFGDDEGESLLD
nr:DUF2815 family protein [Butyrivibrio sp. MB2005]